MFRALLAAALLAGGLTLFSQLRGNKISAAAAARPELQNSAAVTDALAEETGEDDDDEESPGGVEAATTLAAIEYFARNQRPESLERMFEAGNLTAVTKAALIDAALDLDDPQLLARAETLALTMIESGGAAEVLAALPRVSQFPENSRVRGVSQESLCRFSGFGSEVVKLKYDRTFPNGRPWAAVCKTS